MGRVTHSLSSHHTLFPLTNKNIQIYLPPSFLSFTCVRDHLSQKLKLLGSGPTMYMMPFNTPPHMRPPLTRTWRDKAIQGAVYAQTIRGALCAQIQRGEINASGRIQTRNLAEPKL